MAGNPRLAATAVRPSQAPRLPVVVTDSRGSRPAVTQDGYRGAPCRGIGRRPERRSNGTLRVTCTHCCEAGIQLASRHERRNSGARGCGSRGVPMGRDEVYGPRGSQNPTGGDAVVTVGTTEGSHDRGCARSQGRGGPSTGFGWPDEIPVRTPQRGPVAVLMGPWRTIKRDRIRCIGTATAGVTRGVSNTINRLMDVRRGSSWTCP